MSITDDPYEILDDQTATSDKTPEQQEAEWEIADLKWLMSSKKGRRVMWRLLIHAGVYRLSYVPGDALGTAFNEGNRNQGQRLLTLIQMHASEDYATMVQERSNAARR